MAEVASRAEHLQRSVARLLTSDEPAIRFRVRAELLGEDAQSPELARLSAEIEAGPKCSRLLEFEDVRVYTKWIGAHWRLVSLVELALPAGHPTAVARCDQLLDSWTAGPHLDNPQTIDGLVREHTGTMGSPLAVACRLGMATDSRAVRFADVLCDWQWPDGGWNCDVNASGRRSSFHETLPTMWGLVEYH